MISFCIPIYNYDVSGLVTELDRQASLEGLPYEIILIDDFSEECKEANSKLIKINSVQYIGLDQNMGRARVRNLFLNFAKFDYLLFLDCDSEIISDGYVKAYYAQSMHDNKVICGGRVYPESSGSKNKKLHWKYGVFRESMPADTRSIDSNKSFMTNNFLIKKEILNAVRFDERITHYGHEDTLFGYFLMKNSIPVKHIDNPVLHGYLEDNPVFVEKTEAGIKNLIRILNYLDDEAVFMESVRILRFYKGFQSKKLLIIAKPLFHLICPLIKFLLTSGFANLTLFDIYKFGFLTLSLPKLQPGGLDADPAKKLD